MGAVQSFVEDTANLLLTPFREIVKSISGAASDQAHAAIDVIHDAGEGLGIDSLASDITSGISSIGSGLGNFANNAGDSLFGAFDAMKYIPYVVVGIGGLFLLNNSDKIIGRKLI